MINGRDVVISDNQWLRSMTSNGGGVVIIDEQWWKCGD